MSSYAHVLGRLLFWDLISSIQKLSGTSCACLQQTLVEVARFRASLLWDDLSKAQDEIVCLCDQEWWTLPMGCKTGVPSTLQLEIVNHLLQERVPVIIIIIMGSPLKLIKFAYLHLHIYR